MKITERGKYYLLSNFYLIKHNPLDNSYLSTHDPHEFAWLGLLSFHNMRKQKLWYITLLDHVYTVSKCYSIKWSQVSSMPNPLIFPVYWHPYDVFSRMGAAIGKRFVGQTSFEMVVYYDPPSLFLRFLMLMHFKHPE